MNTVFNQSPSPFYQCPLCASTLQLQPNSRQYACANRHHFDLAKEGYLNLLPVQQKGSLTPGDNKPMIVARRLFLEAGYYDNMATTVAALLKTYHPPAQPLRLLDLGCGEGYYSRAVAAALSNHTPLQSHGLDIAKFAVAAAAKKQPAAQFVVASANRLPFSEAYFDAVMRVFAPSKLTELQRVLKPNGLLLTVTPGARHLWQLKTFIYAEPREHPLELTTIEGFTPLATERIHYTINPNSEQRLALLQMTPFAWRTHPDAQQAIQAPASLDIEVDFCITVFQKN